MGGLRQCLDLRRFILKLQIVAIVKCDFCPSATLGRKGRVMTESDFIHILNEVKPYTNYLYFHLLGEPFLNPRIGRFLELSHEAGMQVNLTTNGTLIKKVEDISNSSTRPQTN